MKKGGLIIFAFLSFSLYSSAQLKLPAFISDSMVLQQSSNAPVWGWATPGQKVQVSGSWSGKAATTIARDTAVPHGAQGM